MLFILDIVRPWEHFLKYLAVLTYSSDSRLLVRHESVMNRLRDEVSSVMGESENPTREQIRRMPYLFCVVKESE